MDEVTITVPRDVDDGLKAASERMNRPVDALVREAIERYLARIETARGSDASASGATFQEPESDDGMKPTRRSS